MTDELRISLDGISDRLTLYGMLFAVSNRIQAIGDNQFDDMTMKQHFLMIVLGMIQPSRPTLNETARLVGCSYQNVKRMAAQLEKSGYVSIVPDTQDRRKQRLVASEKFTRVNAEKQAMADAFMNTLYRDIPDDDLRGAIRALRRMDENLGGLYG